MAVYMTQFNYTSEAWAALAKNPTNRRETIDKVFQAVGGRLIELYYCLGEYDGVLLVEAPDDSAIVSALVAVAGPATPGRSRRRSCSRPTRWWSRCGRPAASRSPARSKTKLPHLPTGTQVFRAAWVPVHVPATHCGTPILRPII